MSNIATYSVTVEAEEQVYPLIVSGDENIPIQVGSAVVVTAGAYQGEYEVTPSLEETVLITRGKIMTQNVVVNPIPSNYGLITWNGAFLKVS